MGSVKLKVSEFVLAWSMCITTWLLVIGNLCMQGALNDTDLAPLLFSIKLSKVRSKSTNNFSPTPLYLLIQSLGPINIVIHNIYQYFINCNTADWELEQVQSCYKCTCSIFWIAIWYNFESVSNIYCLIDMIINLLII